MKSLQLLSLLALALVVVSLSYAETLEEAKVQKDSQQECVICK